MAEIPEVQRGSRLKVGEYTVEVIGVNHVHTSYCGVSIELTVAVVDGPR